MDSEDALRRRQWSEQKAMRIVAEFERICGRQPEDVSRQKGRSFDMFSYGPPDPATGQREVRRIEVKGRQINEPVTISREEWNTAVSHPNSYWLYVVINPTGSSPELLIIRNPASKLSPYARTEPNGDKTVTISVVRKVCDERIRDILSFLEANKVADRRLIEDFLPIGVVNEEAGKEKSWRQGNISTLHIWWARRPTVACRAAVYASLVPADEHAPNTDKPSTRRSLSHANANNFIARLCRRQPSPEVIKEARQRILNAHKKRTGLDTPPRVLDCFAGGGAIPLEALRLGCETYALELNPVAFLILLGTIVYPQKYAKPDPKSNWEGLAKEVEKWGLWVLERVKSEVGDLYPDIELDADNPSLRLQRHIIGLPKPGSKVRLKPVAYLWTRTVPCSSFGCGGTVPLVRQTWLCRRTGKTSSRFAALKISPRPDKKPRFSLLYSHGPSEKDAVKEFGFDPGKLSRKGEAACPFCGTAVSTEYVKQCGQNGKIGYQLMAVVCTIPEKQGKIYIAESDLPQHIVPDERTLKQRLEKLKAEGLTPPDEPLLYKAADQLPQYGYTTYGALFTQRQLVALLTFLKHIRAAYKEMLKSGYSHNHATAVLSYLALWNDRVTDYLSNLCSWHNTREVIGHTLARQAIPMVWDFAEVNPFGDASGNAFGALEWVTGVLKAMEEEDFVNAASVVRGTVTELPYEDNYFDAVITDPPYYDNISYAALSDFFYVWQKRILQDIFPEHFSARLTPKQEEIIADAYRQGSKEEARRFYEQMMQKALSEMHRVLKPDGILTMVYAHKTVAGWETLINALRDAGFVVTQAWPLRTEMKTRLLAMGSAALASSIFIVARKVPQEKVGLYPHVRREVERIVYEKLAKLWDKGLAVATDLLIACLGAALKAYTRYRRVEMPSGEEVPATRFLQDVEGVVQDAVLARLVGGEAQVKELDLPTRLYVLWRHFYGKAWIEAGDAIVFAYPSNVELDGPSGLTSGKGALLEKKGSKYRLRDYEERGELEDLGLKGRFGLLEAPLIDVLHRLLWLLEKRRVMADEFLNRARPNEATLKLLAQALAGGLQQGGLKFTTDKEQSMVQRLLTNWDDIVGRGKLFRR